MAKYLNSLPHKYWSIGVIYGRKDKTPPNNIFGSFDHENAVWFSPETTQGNTWNGRVYDPFKFGVWSSELYPGLQDEGAWKLDFPYDCNGQPWRR